ncbi:MAG TPA: PQQ-binding-like beta-propeller repeat protein [Pyrinomonadaceae bacterium]|nr:PQQ-binding-like beta-propeller repeat protein [Pyrinomonadaceae bacterium]
MPEVNKELFSSGRAGRHAFSLALLLTVAFFLSPARAAAQWADPNNWSQFRGNHQLTGVSKTDVPKNIRPLWNYQAGAGVESSAAIAYGTVFVGSQDGVLAALDLGNGAVRWKYNTGSKEGIGESSPAVANGLVYVGDLGGTIHAVNASNGRGAWTFKTGGEIKSSPVAVDDKILIGSYDGHLYCLDARSGAVRWKVKTNGPVHATAGVSGGTAYIAGCDEVFRAIRISDGRELYTVASGAYTGASPALMNNSAFYGTFDNYVLGVNLSTRRISWRYRNAQRQFPFYSSAGAVENRVVLGGRDKYVHCLDARTGKALWTFGTRARVESSPALASGRVFVGSSDGRFYVLDFYSGAKVWEFDAGAALSASPAVASGRIVIGSQDGRVYCFG